MANIRNKRQRVIQNTSEHYKEIVQKRGVKRISHYTTPIMRHPTVGERSRIDTVGHVWTLGDRFYKLAHQYYGDVRFWWVIAWWNGYPTEASVQTGDFLDIPLNLGDALEVLGV